MSRTSRDPKARRQSQREETAWRQRARDRRNLVIIVASVLLVGVGILGVAAYLRNSEPHRPPFSAQTGTVGQPVPDEGRGHVSPAQPVEYQHYPPTSGAHYGSPDAPAPWQTIGPLPEGVFLHNLEHGGIAILYQCPTGAACDTLQSQLANYVRNLAPREPRFREVKLVMTPYTRGMEHKIALLAWDWMDQFDDYDQDRITRFYEAHVDHGPEQVP